MHNHIMNQPPNETFPGMQPMPIGLSLAAFGVPAGLVFVGFHVGMPALIRVGVYPFYAFALSIGVPLVLMFCASLVAFKREGNSLSIAGIRSRFRLHAMTGKAWLYTVATFIIFFVAYGIISQLMLRLITQGIMPVPTSLPAWLDPRAGFPDMGQAFGGLSGNWWALVAYLVFLVVNVIGEEFWWRGVILPRQELAFGKWVWVIHGCLWACFHAFKWWDIAAILPLALGLSFVVWKLKNNTPGIVLHFMWNGLGLIPIVIGILG